ncbi:MAG: transcription termination/antitermination protein NusG [bacterium]|nr:transcription termination/antitermination protein NusG [bacterium]
MIGWYIVHTSSSQEKRVSGILQGKMENELKDIVYDVKVPVEKVVEMKNSKKVSKERKFFPGYILVKMEMNNENVKRLTMIPGIANVLGFKTGKLPKPLTEKELNNILNKVESVKTESEKPISKVFVSVDEKVKIIDGPFKGFQGIVEGINMEKGLVKVSVEIFGRPTPVDLDFLQIEKL